MQKGKYTFQELRTNVRQSRLRGKLSHCHSPNDAAVLSAGHHLPALASTKAPHLKTPKIPQGALGLAPTNTNPPGEPRPISEEGQCCSKQSRAPLQNYCSTPHAAESHGEPRQRPRPSGEASVQAPLSVTRQRPTSPQPPAPPRTYSHTLIISVSSTSDAQPVCTCQERKILEQQLCQQGTLTETGERWIARARILTPSHLRLSLTLKGCPRKA